MQSTKNLPKEILFLDRPTVELLHAQLIDLYGGSHGLRDEHLLESALAQPQAGFGDQYAHSTIFEMAAAYLFHVTKNHAFVDGNKRIGFACMDTFLRLNGYELDMDSEANYAMVLNVAKGILDKQKIAVLLEEHTTAIE